jgi:predicted N-acetyltransferase YhbS
VKIRFEDECDRAQVAAVHRAAFGEHGVVVARLVDDLRGLVAKGGSSRCRF